MNWESLKQKIYSEEVLPLNFLRFYAVGFVLYVLPYTRPLFFHITTLSLLLTVVAVFYHHKNWSIKSILVFSTIAIVSFFLEMTGVHTEQLFGSYQYDMSLAPKIKGTPLIIGINWLFLVYASQSIVSRFTRLALVKVVCGAGLMVVYDSLMEIAAPYMKMWHFSSSYPPFQNFLVWFLAAFLFHSLLVGFRIEVKNKAASALFWSQLLFFTLISLFSILFIS